MKVNWDGVLIYLVFPIVVWAIIMGSVVYIGAKLHKDLSVVQQPMIVQESPMPTFRQMVIEVPMDSTTTWRTVLSNYDTLYITRKPYREVKR